MLTYKLKSLIKSGKVLNAWRILAFIRKKQYWNYSLQGIISSKKHMNSCLLIDRYERFNRILKKHLENIIEIDFKDKSIYELGCGPLLGLGPLSIFLNGLSYAYDDPFLDNNILKSDSLKDMYFKPLYDELCANYGNKITFKKFYEEIFCKSTNGIKNLRQDIDFIFSNSVLEHIPKEDINTIFHDIYMKHKTGGSFLHAVDFGSHGTFGKESGLMYVHDREKVKTRTSSLNFYRKSEMKNQLENVGWNVSDSITYRKININRSDLNPSWLSYSDDDLESMTVLFFGTK